MNKHTGIFPALLTPFTKDGRINEKELERLIEYNIQKGVAGFYVNGSTQEAFLLSEEERRLIYRLVKEICGNRVTLYAHVGCVSTEQAIGYGRYAATLGYDAISAVAPFYYKFSLAEIKEHYRMIAHAVDLPLILYNIPAFSGVSLSFDDFAELLTDDRMIGVKYTSADHFLLQRLCAAYPSKCFFNGYDETFAAGLMMGVHGGIGSTYNFMAEKFIDMQTKFEQGDIAGVQAKQDEVNRIVAALCRVGVMQGEKALLDMLGFDFGPCRAPFAPLSAEAKQYLADTVLPLL